MNTLLAFSLGAPGFGEMMIVGIIALLLFGKRLPEVARSFGKGITEFKKGVRGIEDDVDNAVDRAGQTASRPAPAEEREAMVAPKFEPPKAAPVAAQNPTEPS